MHISYSRKDELTNKIISTPEGRHRNLVISFIKYNVENTTWSMLEKPPYANREEKRSCSSQLFVVIREAVRLDTTMNMPM